MSSPTKYNNLKIINHRYQLLNNLLGKGNYGEIYLTVDLQNNHKIACKMISKSKLMQRLEPKIIE
jgi:hypothetical protein